VTEVEIRWSAANEELLRSGRKLATIRRERHAKAGDTFRAGGWTWRVDSVSPSILGHALDTVYPLLGVASREEALAGWMEVRGLTEPPDLGQVVYVHTFSRVLPG
jgi:hypothetical protein